MIPTPEQVRTMADKIQLLRQTADALQTLSADVPAIERNTVRILASVKMLELNIEHALLRD
jgi:hypothetical protein